LAVIKLFKKWDSITVHGTRPICITAGNRKMECLRHTNIIVYIYIYIHSIIIAAGPAPASFHPK
jgi:hypothetical protein